MNDNICIVLKNEMSGELDRITVASIEEVASAITERLESGEWPLDVGDSISIQEAN